MYVRFETPTKKDGTPVLATARGKGFLVARAAIGPLNPAFPNVELTSFGVWKNHDGSITVTPPEGTSNFPHLMGRPVKSVSQVEGETDPVVTWIPTAEGKKEIDQLLTMITKVYTTAASDKVIGRHDLPIVETNGKATPETTTSAGANPVTNGNAPAPKITK